MSSADQSLQRCRNSRPRTTSWAKSAVTSGLSSGVAASPKISGLDFDSGDLFEHADRAADIVFSVTLGHCGLKELLRETGK
jgi:hypothetical protein